MTATLPRLNRRRSAKELVHAVREFLADDEAQALVEYALIVSLLSISCLAGFHYVTGAANNNLSTTSNNLTSTSANPP